MIQKAENYLVQLIWYQTWRQNGKWFLGFLQMQTLNQMYYLNTDSSFYSSDLTLKVLQSQVQAL